jgi:hypothetical protein
MEPNLGNRVNVPTIRSADPLVLPLPKHFCGCVRCPDERRKVNYISQLSVVTYIPDYALYPPHSGKFSCFV